MKKTLQNWSDESLISQLQCMRDYHAKFYKPRPWLVGEAKRHQEKIAEVETEIARRQAARSA
jgi:hypothetical protein